MGLLYGLGLRIMNLMVFFLVVILIPGLPPRTTFPFAEFDIAPTKDLKGALEPNYHLDNAERLLDGRVCGPESLIARNNEIYTGIHGGEVIKLTADHVTHVAKLGQPCEDLYEESRCGRPLGLAFDTQGNNLIIADAYYGIWLVDLSSNRKKLLVSPQQELPGKNDVNRRAKVFNGVAVDQRGDIYWTDSSSDFTIQDLVFASFANPSGRLFKYDRSKNVSEVLLDELFFANGVVVSPDEEFVVVAETGAMRLTKYYVKGAKAGKSEVFVEGLPGMPDNLTPDEDGIWVPLVMAADSEHPNSFGVFAKFPMLRLFFARLLALFELPFRLLNNAYPNKFAQRAIHFIGHGDSITLFSPKRTTVVRVDWNGNIVGSLHGFDRTVGGVSHVLEFNEHLYLGSPFNRYLARVKSPKPSKQPAGGNVKVKNVRYEGVMEPVVKMPTEATTTAAPPKAKPTTTTTTTTTPKPTTTTTTTTPRPTTTTTTTTTPKPTPKPTPKTTPKQTATTTPKPPTTRPTTKPTTASTTSTPTPTTTAKPPTTTTAKPKPAPAVKPTAKPQPATAGTAAPKRVPPKQPAPVKEEIPNDTKPPQQQEKLKVVNQRGEHVEL